MIRSSVKNHQAFWGYSIAGALLCGCWAAHSASATVLVNDAFTDGGLTNGIDAQDLVWTQLTSSAGTVGVGAFNTSGNTSNALVLDNLNHTAAYPMVRGMDTGVFSTTLTIGNTLTLSLDFRLTSIGNSNLRIGLGTSNAGYGFIFGTGTTTGGGFNVWTTANALAGSTRSPAPSLTGGAAFAINDTNAHTLTFTITAIDATHTTYSANVDGSHLFTATDAGFVSGNATFDRILLVTPSSGSGSPAAHNDFNIDNVRVVTAPIPEPATLTLLAIGSLALAVRRR